MANVAFKTYVQALDNKTTPTGADSLVIIDSADSNNDKETTITGIYNYVKSNTDTLYAPVLGADDNYVTDAQKIIIGNTSGTNTGDNATNSQYSGLAASKQDNITLTTTGSSGAATLVGSTLNIPQYSGGAGLSDGDKGDITVSGSGTVWNIDAATVGTTELSASGTPSSSTFLRGDNTWATPAGSGDVSKVGTPVNNQVGVWTGDGTIEGDTALTFDTTTDTLATTNITATTVTANLVGNVTGNVSGTSGSTTGNAATVTTNANLTGHITSVGNAAVLGSFTKAQLDAAVSDGNVLYVGDVTQYTDELAQDAVGAMVDTSLVYVDGTPLLTRAALTGDITASQGSNATTIANAAITLAKMANLAQDQFIGRTTASTGVPETATITAAARTVLDDTTVSAMVDTLGGATSTGTGGLARATSPVFTTPNIGSATGSISGNAATVTTNANMTGDVTSSGSNATTVKTNLKLGQITMMIGDGVNAISANATSFVVPCTFAGTITGYTIAANAGTCTIKTWKKATGTAIPTIADVISTSGVALSSGTVVRSTTVTDFTSTAVTANDLFIIQATSVATAKYISFTLEITKS